MTKKEKVVDLKPTQVSEKHLKEIQTTVSEINKTYMELGRLLTTQHSFLHNLANKQEILTSLQKDLKKEYGTDNINIEDGTINYSEDDKVN